MTDPRDAERWDAADEGAELLREGEVDAAVRHLEEVLKDDPDNHYAAGFLGAAHFEAKRWDKALKAYVRALELEPDFLGAMAGAGQTLRMMGRHDQAIRMGNQILARRKEDADALYLLGLVHFQRDDKARARDYLERFLATSPEIEVALEVEGILKVLRGETVPLEESS